MPEFQMDKSEAIRFPSGEVLHFTDLAAFTQGYVEAMLFTETASGVAPSMVEWDEPEVQEGISEGSLDGRIPGDAGFGDIHPDSFARLQVDCINFEHRASALLRQAFARGYSRSQAGHDFWFTRNGHGVGFWDRKELEADGLGEALSDVARSFGESDAAFAPDPESPTGYGYVHLS